MCLGMANGGKSAEMTDKEIIKALDDRMYCGKWIGKGFLDKKDFQILKNAFDLINRQQSAIDVYMQENDRLKTAYIQVSMDRDEAKAEIERLNSCVKSEDEVRAIANATIQAGIKIIKATAIKEFADRLKEHLKGNGGLFCVTTMNAHIDNLVKEMVGEGNG